MKILVIDDDPDIVELMGLTLEIRWPDSNVVAAPDGDTGIQMVDTERPALVLLDIGLPDMDGFNVCREIRRFSDVPIVMVTVRQDQADIIHGLQVGADDYIVKPFRPIELMARVQSVLRRAQVSYLSGHEQPFHYRDLTVDFYRQEVYLREKLIHLTPVEFQLLALLAKNAGKTMNHRTLLGRIWGRDNMEAGSNYLKVHIKHLRQKLGDDPGDSKYILNERGVGYKIPKVEKH